MGDIVVRADDLLLHERLHVDAVAKLGGDPPGGGMRVRDIALILEAGEFGTDRRRRDDCGGGVE